MAMCLQAQAGKNGIANTIERASSLTFTSQLVSERSSLCTSSRASSEA